MIHATDSAAGRRPRVVIIGGGLAGLAAAEAIARSGAPVVVTLLEARRATGGRAGSFLDPATGQSIDYCQHVAMGCCTNLLDMLDACGLGGALARTDRLSFHHPTAPTSTFAASTWLPAPLHLLPAFQSLAYLSPSQHRQVRHATWRLMRCRSQELRAVRAIDWLHHHGQGEATIRDYWNVIIASALGESCEAVSMAVVRKVFIDGFLAARGASDVLIPREPLSKLFGVQLPQAIRSRGVNIMTQTAVRSLRMASDDRLLVDLGYTQMSVDHAILAVPWHQVQKIVDPALAARAAMAVDLWAAFPSSPISGVHLWFDRPITDSPHAVLIGTLAQWLFQRPAQPPSDPGRGAQQAHAEQAGHYYQVVISASHGVREMPHPEVVRRIVADLAVAFPLAASAKLLRSRVVTDPHSVFSIRPEVDAARPATATALPCLHLAGDFVQTGWPATMEGAVISGRRAANNLLRPLAGMSVNISEGLPRNWLSRLLIR